MGEDAGDTQVNPLEAGARDTRCGNGDARDAIPTCTHAAFKGGCWMHKRSWFVVPVGHCT